MSKLIAGGAGNKTELDLGSEVSIPLTFNMADVKNLSSRSGAYSKTIALPGTAVNNRFFGGLYDVNADFTQFNPNVRTDIVLTVADMEVLVGFLQLKTIDVNDEGFVTYNVVLFDSTVNFMTDLGGLLVVKNPKTSDERDNNTKSVNDIKFNAEPSATPAIIADTILNLNHYYAYTYISNSWNQGWDNRGYYYPLLNGATTTIKVEDFQPAIYHKTLLDAIIRHHGYTWSGSLKDNTDYERDVIPYTGVTPKESELDASARTFRAGITPLGGGFGAGITNLVNYTPPDPTTYFGALNSEPSINMDDESDIVGGFFDNNDRWNGTDIYTAINKGRYYFKHSLNFLTQLQYDKSFGTPAGAPLSYKMSYGIHAEVYNSASSLQYTTELNSLNEAIIPITYSSGNSLNTESESTINGSRPFQVVVPANSIDEPYFSLNAGDYIKWIIDADSNGLIRSNGTDYTGNKIDVENIKVSLISEPNAFEPTPPCYIECVKVISDLNEWQYIDYSEFIPKKLKQSDIIHDLIARYNCIIYPNPNNINDIVFDIGEDFYSDGLTADWSHKRDANNRDKITMLGEAQTSKALLTYTPAKDANNVNYSEASGETFGQYEYDFDNDFATTVKTIKSPFEPTELIMRAGGAIVPALNPSSSTAKFRVLSASEHKVNFKQSTTHPYFSINYRAVESSSHMTTTILNAYPYAGCFNYPVNTNGVANASWKPSVWKSINFGQLAFLNADLGNEQPSVTLQSLYWSSALRQTSKAKLLEGMFNLNVADLDFIRLNPNAKVYVSSKWWRVNKLTLEANDNLRRLTKVELVSVE